MTPISVGSAFRGPSAPHFALTGSRTPLQHDAALPGHTDEIRPSAPSHWPPPVNYQTNPQQFNAKCHALDPDQKSRFHAHDGRASIPWYKLHLGDSRGSRCVKERQLVPSKREKREKSEIIGQWIAHDLGGKPYSWDLSQQRAEIKCPRMASPDWSTRQPSNAVSCILRGMMHAGLQQPHSIRHV